MSQKVCLISVDGELIRKVFNHVPEYDELIQILKENGYTAKGYERGVSDYYLVYYDWFEINSDEEHYIEDEALLDLYQTYDFSAVVAETFDAEVTTLDVGDIEVLYEDLEEK